MDREHTIITLLQNSDTTIRIVEEGTNRHRIVMPFTFDDGDHIPTVLSRDKSGVWCLTDEGHTIMRLTYLIDEGDLRSGNRQKTIEASLERNGIREEDGVLSIPLKDIPPAVALSSLIQGITQISEIR